MPTGAVSASPAAERMLVLGDAGGRRERPLADVMCRFEWWEDRAGFLRLFDPVQSADDWTGTAVIADEVQRCRRHFYVVARRCTSTAGQCVRALIHDLTDLEPPPRLDIRATALRCMPIREGHAIGLTDVGSWLIHDWIAIDHTPLARWRHEEPEIHSEDSKSIAECRAALLAGAESSECSVRFRFSRHDRWDTVWAEWRILSRYDHLQAMFDITWIPR
ncbi:hypothetical protein [Nocardia brasiliensis]|uniref:hypothetical protein n=1 Tax=Nocardia brasiliensis TaxID=37326 RepID=UPI0024570D88|nr:hypothetical protein [Nocardia brasiliensis]